MPVDNSAAESARSLLNGIDYSALIGGPLQAAITAQAMAAKSTWEFIQQVGLNTDKDGNRSAINVSFAYQRDGQMVRLIVPLLTIVPIPLIVVDEISIDFTANINASASSTSEDTKSQDIAGELEAEAKLGWGPFSVTARMKASYSSKQSSKATQDSRYSVEYTQVVRVHARQADMPAGLATVLNILASAATGGTMNGELSVSPPLAYVTQGNEQAMQLLQITTKNANGLNVPADVTVSIASQFDGCFALSDQLTGSPIAWSNSGATLTAMVKTNSAGSLALNFNATSALIPTGVPYPVLTFVAQIDPGGQNEEIAVPVSVTRPLAPPVTAPTLTVSPGRIVLATASATETVTLTGLPATAANGVTVTPTVTPTGEFTAVPTGGGTAITLTNGVATVTVGRTATATTGTIQFAASIDGASVTATLTISDTTFAVSPIDVITLSRPRPQPGMGGLNAQADSTSHFYTFTQEPDDAGAYGPVSVRILSPAVAVQSDDRTLESGDTLVFDAQHRARIRFEVGPDIEAAEAHVRFEQDGRPVQALRFD